jgi:penicillin-binding protein 1C
VHTLRKMGPSAVLARLRAAGLTTLDRPDDRYDASLAIGDATVRLIELTGAYATFGTGGTSVVPTALTTIEQPGLAPVHTAAGVGNRVFAPEIAYLVFDILSDPDARRPMFGRDVPMELPFPVALKTGTTRAYTDNLAFGVTREYTVGAWAGNADGTPTDGVMAMQGAAPLVRAAFVALAARFGDPTAPPRPDSMVEADVCPLSGMRPGPHCPTRKHEIFVPGTVPEEECTWHRQACGEDEIDYPEALRGWVRAHGMLHPSPCATSDTTLRILFPVNDSHFLIDPDRPRDQQLPPLRAAPARFQNDVVWSVDGRSVRDFLPSPGEHVVRASWNGQQAEVRVSFE